MCKKLLAGLFMCSLFISGAVQAAPSNEKIFAHIKTIMLSPEYGQSEPVVSRWERSPKLSLFGADAEETEMVEDLILELNGLLKDSKFEIQLSRPYDPKAEIKVHFLSRDLFPAIAAENKFEYVRGNAGFFHVWWNPGHAINRAVVLIEHQLKDKKKRHYIYEEITQSLGFMNDSPDFSDSLFYQKGRDGGSITRFGKLDQKIIRFIYQHTNPGYSEAKLFEAFNKYWKDL